MSAPFAALTLAERRAQPVCACCAEVAAVTLDGELGEAVCRPCAVALRRAKHQLLLSAILDGGGINGGAEG
jgi:hypothetical protein